MFLAQRLLALRLSLSLLSSGFLRLPEAAEVAAEPVHTGSRPESRRGHPLLGADLAQPAGQDRRVCGTDTGRGRRLHPGTLQLFLIWPRPFLSLITSNPLEIIIHFGHSLSAVYRADPLQLKLISVHNMVAKVTILFICANKTYVTVLETQLNFSTMVAPRVWNEANAFLVIILID